MGYQLGERGRVVSDSPIPHLTEQELACLQGVADLKRSKQIGYELGLQPGTVDTYIARAVRKLGVADRHSAVRLLIEEGMLSRKSGSGISDVEPSVAVDHPPMRRFAWWPPFTGGRDRIDEVGYFGVIGQIMVAASVMLAAFALYALAIRMFGEWRLPS